MPLIKNDSPNAKLFEEFSSKINFKLPAGYLEFINNSNGAEGQLRNSYFVLWPIEEVFDLNRDYNVDEFAPGFFIIGSDGADTAFAVDKKSGDLYEMPFIGMSRDEAILRAKDFKSLLEYLDSE
jgi:hypothetical protein